jgi:hypothetical protein
MLPVIDPAAAPHTLLSLLLHPVMYAVSVRLVPTVTLEELTCVVNDEVCHAKTGAAPRTKSPNADKNPSPSALLTEIPYLRFI